MLMIHILFSGKVCDKKPLQSGLFNQGTKCMDGKGEHMLSEPWEFSLCLVKKFQAIPLLCF